MWKNLLFIDVRKVSLVSAQKLRCPSSAQLGLEPFQLNSSQLRRFRLAEESILFELYSFCLLTKKCYDHIFFHWSESMRELIFKKIELSYFFSHLKNLFSIFEPSPYKRWWRHLWTPPYWNNHTLLIKCVLWADISISIDLWADGCRMANIFSLYVIYLFFSRSLLYIIR